MISLYLPSGSAGPHRQASKFRFLASFLPHLDEDDERRYRDAHRFAARFCRRLEERFLRSRRARPEVEE